MNKHFRIAMVVLAIPAISSAFAADYIQAPGSTLAFAGKYQGEIFTGRFPDFSTAVSFDPAQPETASLDVNIALARATAGSDDYDSELRGSGFFDVVKFSHAHYRAKGFRRLGDGRYATDGVLSLHGIEKPVTLTLTWTNAPKPVLIGKATVKRLDFGVGAGDWADTALIANDIAISTKVVLRPKK